MERKRWSEYRESRCNHKKDRFLQFTLLQYGLHAFRQRCVCLSSIAKCKMTANASEKQIRDSPKGGEWTGGIVSLSSLVSVTEIPIIHCWRTFLFSAIGMWSNSSWLPW